MEQYQPHNSIDPSHPVSPFFNHSASATTEPPPVNIFTPVQPPAPNQISYDEMIVAAISALGEKDGSSRQAIAKYIDRVYTNLPSNHSVLLTHHLKKLKITGQLDMVKHSYRLPSRSTPPPPLPPAPAANPVYTPTTPVYSFHPPPPSPSPAPASPLYTSSVPTSGPTYFTGSITASNFPETTGDAPASVPSSQPKKRGRPAKPKPDVAPPAFSIQNLAQPNMPNQTVQAQYQNLSPTNGPNQTFQAQHQNLAPSNGPNQTFQPQHQNLAPPNGPAHSVQAHYENVVNEPVGTSQNVVNEPVESGQNVDGLIGSNQNINGPAGSGQGVLNGSGELTEKKKRGRPRKDKASPAQYTSFSNEAQNDSIPPVISGLDPTLSVSGSEAMLVSLGLSDGPSNGSPLTKMRPRRMKKPTFPVDPTLTETKRKKTGRPRKVQPTGATLAPGVFPVQVPVGDPPAPAAAAAPSPVFSSGKRRGRPKKYVVAPGPAPAVVPGEVNGVVNAVQPKKRGRKPKSVTNGAFSVPVSFMLPEEMNGGGGVIVPQDGGVVGSADVGAIVVSVSGGDNMGTPYQSTGKRGRGRPPRMGGSGSGGVMKPRKLSGKPLGRPRKNPSGSEDQSFTIKNLEDKIEYLQTTIKEAVPLIKPCINAGEANAREALGQLEELATADLITPVTVQTQQNVEIQQQPPPPPQQVQAELHSNNNGF